MTVIFSRYRKFLIKPIDSIQCLEDKYTVAANSTTVLDVLANDINYVSGSLTLVSITSPSAGSATIVDNKVTYVAPSNPGIYMFKYTAKNANNFSATADITVTVT